MNEVNIENLLTSVLYRADSIIDCLPINLQDNMRDVRNGTFMILKETTDNFFDNDVLKKYNAFLDMVSLYQELNCILRDLSICIIISPNNVILEDALYNIDFIMMKMADYDSVFDYCYSRSKIRILK